MGKYKISPSKLDEKNAICVAFRDSLRNWSQMVLLKGL